MGFEYKRIYKCPICGKSYTSLEDMYTCGIKCEKKEKEKIEAEKAKLAKSAEFKADENVIQKAYDELYEKIKSFNKKYKGKSSYQISLVHKTDDHVLNDKDEKEIENLINKFWGRF